MYQATHNLGGDHMRKLLIPMFLSISLVACNNTNTPEANNQSEKTTKVASNENEKVASEENLTEKDDPKDNEDSEKTDLKDNENSEKTDLNNDKTNVEKSDKDHTAEHTARKDQIAEIKEKANEKYEQMKKEPATISIDGSETDLDFENLSSRQAIEKLGLDLVSEEDAYEENINKSIYKTQKGNEISIQSSDDEFFVYMENFADTEIKLPFEISSSDTPEEAINKLKDLYLTSEIDNDNMGENVDYILFATKNLGYGLTYKDKKLETVDISYQDDDIINQHILANLAYDLPEDKSASLAIEGHEFTFPINYNDLAKSIGGQLEEANQENIQEFLDENFEMEQTNMDDFLSNKLILNTGKGKYLVEYIKEEYADPDKEAFQADNISSITFNKEDKEFSFSNNDLELTNENFDSWVGLIKDSGLWYDDMTDMRIYLDDYTSLSFDDNQINLYSIDKNSRAMDELNITIGN